MTVTAEDGITVKVYRVMFSAPVTPGGDPTGIADREAERWQVYPNPATDRVTVEARGRVTLLDLYGRMVLAADGPTVLDLGALPSGLYLLRCGDTARRLLKR